MLFFKKQKTNLKGKPVRYYPVVVTVGKPANTQEIAERISKKCTLTPSDVHAVIRALPDVMAEIMSEGRSVNMEGLGSFRYAGVTTGQSVDSEEKISAAQIKALRVRFVPARTKVPLAGGYTRSLVGNIEFAEWQGKRKKKASAESPGGSGGSQGAGTGHGEAPDPSL